MIRLLVTLNVMLVVVAVLYTFAVNKTLNTILRAPIEDNYQQRGKGSMQLLNESVAGLDAGERQKKLLELQEHFVYPLNLRQLSTFGFNKYERERLLKGLIVWRDIEGADHVYAKLSDTDEWAWEFALDLPKVLDEANASAGTFYLLQQQLLGKPEQEWQAIIAKRQPQFGFPVILHKPGAVTLSEAEQQQVDSGEILVVIHDEYSETHYQRVGDSEYVLQLGTFETPAIGRHLNWIILGFFLLIILLASYFWLLPMWRNLMQIRTAAEAFGNGEYDTRVPYHKRSRLAVLTRAFNAMAERTQKSIRAQKNLTSAVSHELRTPVARMRFSLDMLGGADNDDDRQRYIKNMHLDIDELNELLEEMLTYARLDQMSDPINMSRTALTAWFSLVMDSLERLANEKTLVWRQADSIEHEQTMMSPVMMSRVVNNLVQNALRYAGSRVEVFLSKTSDNYVLQIDDDGPGIPESECERLFSAFAIQEDSRNKELAGFGLGLAIVKRIVEGHRGEVSIADSALGGAQFIVRWPIRP